ncbi:MAG: MFS transporter [Chloroflexi bacterium]|nr:MFS transporter [Chloroflexota bacterium]
MSVRSVKAIIVSPEVRQGRNKLAATVITGHAIKHIFNSALQVSILPAIGVSLGLSGAQFGALSTAQRITSGVSTMGAGYLGDRFAGKSGLMLALSLALIGISQYALGSAPSYWYMFAAMLVIGIGPSFYHPPAIASLSRKFPDKRGFMIALHGTGGSVGNLIGPVLTGALLAGLVFTAVGWRLILHLSLIPAIIVAVAVYFMMRKIPTEDESTRSFGDYFSGLFGLLRQKAMIGLVAITGLRSMGQSAVNTFLPLYLLKDLGYSPFEVGLFMASAQVVGVGAQPIMGSLSDKYGRKVVLIPAATALGLLYIALRYADPGLQLILVVGAMGAFQYSLHSIFIAAAMDVGKGESQSTVVSLIYGAGFFGTIAPFVAGIIVDASQTRNAFVFAGFTVLAAVLIFAMVKLPKTANQLASASDS